MYKWLRLSIWRRLSGDGSSSSFIVSRRLAFLRSLVFYSLPVATFKPCVRDLWSKNSSPRCRCTARVRIRLSCRSSDFASQHGARLVRQPPEGQLTLGRERHRETCLVPWTWTSPLFRLFRTGSLRRRPRCRLTIRSSHRRQSVRSRRRQWDGLYFRNTRCPCSTNRP